MPSFERESEHGVDRIAFAPEVLIMAGWTGRDRGAVDHHIAELAGLGVPGPTRIPTFYRLDPALLAGPVPEIQVLGADTSGEVEVVLLSFPDGLSGSARITPTGRWRRTAWRSPSSCAASPWPRACGAWRR